MEIILCVKLSIVNSENIFDTEFTIIVYFDCYAMICVYDF